MKFKGMILALAMTFASSAMAMDPASQFVQTVLGRAEQIVTLHGANRDAQLCSLIRAAADSNYIGTQWLGNYATSSDTAGVRLFIKLVPSIVVTKLNGLLSKNNGSGATITVSPTATDRGGGIFGVDISVQTSSNSYNGTAVVSHNNGWRLMDGEYMGFSGVNYYASDFQQMMDNAASNSSATPVSDADNQIMSQSGFIRCN